VTPAKKSGKGTETAKSGFAGWGEWCVHAFRNAPETVGSARRLLHGAIRLTTRQEKDTKRHSKGVCKGGGKHSRRRGTDEVGKPECENPATVNAENPGEKNGGALPAGKGHKLY